MTKNNGMENRFLPKNKGIKPSISREKKVLGYFLIFNSVKVLTRGNYPLMNKDIPCQYLKGVIKIIFFSPKLLVKN